MRELYDRAKAALARIDFGAIWPGFREFPFAFYDEQSVTLERGTMPRDDRFRGNTAIDFEGSPLAIWDLSLSPLKTPSEAVHCLAHEMFHCFQSERGERRYPQDLVLLTASSPPLYDHLRFMEGKALARRELEGYADLLFSRRSLDEARFLQESRAEMIEGAAEYAGLMALAKMDMEAYRKEVGKIEEILLGGELVPDRRRLCYYSGAMTFLLLEEKGVDFDRDLSSSRTTAEELLSRRTDVVTPGIAESEERVRNAFDAFFSGKHREVRLEARITGYDPMNLLSSQNLLYHKHFVGIGDKVIPGPVVTIHPKTTFNEIVGYYQKA